MNILLADPTRTWLRASALKLRRHGVQVETAADARGIMLALHRSGPFDGALLDVNLLAAAPGKPGFEPSDITTAAACWPRLPVMPSASTASWFACPRPISSAALLRVVSILVSATRHRLLALDVAGEVVATHHDAAAVNATLARFDEEFAVLATPMPPDQWERARHRIEGACAALGAQALAAHLRTLHLPPARGDAQLAALKLDTLAAFRAMVPLFFPPS